MSKPSKTEDKNKSIPEILKVLDDWMDITSVNNDLGSAVDTTELRLSLIGFDRTIQSFRSCVSECLHDDTWKAWKALQVILKTDFNKTTGQEIIEYALEFRTQLNLCRIAMMENNRKPAETGQRARDGGDTYHITASHVSLGNKAQHATRDITPQEPDKEKGGWGLIKKISLWLGIVVALIIIFETYEKYIRKDKNEVSKVSNNFIFQFNAPAEILFNKNRDLQEGPQSGAIESPQIAPNREKYFKYLPNGLKQDNDGVEITNTSRELKRFFDFTKGNFTKTITGKQFKEMNSLLNQILSKEPGFAYAWFYRGLLFSLASVNPEFKDKFSSIAESSFKKADDLFIVLLEKHPNDPYLLLYKGMNLTHLDRGKESVSYLKKALGLEPDIFQKKQVLGIIACWNHIDPNYLQEWQTAMDKY